MYGETLPCSIYFSSFTRHCAPGAVHDATTKPTASRRVVIFGKMLQVHLYRYMKPIPLIVHPPKTKTEAENHISQTSMFGFHVSFQVCKSSKNATSLSAGLHLFGERFSVSVNPLEHSSTFYSMPMHIKCTEFAQNTWKYHFPKHFQYRSELFSFLRLFFLLKGNCASTNQSHPSMTAREKNHSISLPFQSWRYNPRCRAGHPASQKQDNSSFQASVKNWTPGLGEKSGTGIQSYMCSIKNEPLLTISCLWLTRWIRGTAISQAIAT